MIRAPRPARGPLWARIDEDEEQSLPLWKALLVAAALELLVPVLVFGVNWSFLDWREPPPTPVMSVRLEPPPEPRPEPPPEPDKRKPKPEKKIKQVALELPPPLPEAPPPKIVLPKPEPQPKPEPKQEEPPPPEPLPEPEPEAPPLPSVFRDVKPVKKVKPVYPREAEDQHIEGRVKVRLSVALDGSVTGVEVLLAEPPGVFEEAVLVAVKQYKFKRDGTTYQADQEIVFRLDE